MLREIIPVKMNCNPSAKLKSHSSLIKSIASKDFSFYTTISDATGFKISFGTTEPLSTTPKKATSQNTKKTTSQTTKASWWITLKM